MRVSQDLIHHLPFIDGDMIKVVEYDIQPPFDVVKDS